ncbi:MAG TPA: hypothetical protein P5307_12680, partial [Pirellulaceae bacterium]|nr:hypothetical protein [Pirellulaceae bacterium]
RRFSKVGSVAAPESPVVVGGRVKITPRHGRSNRRRAQGVFLGQGGREAGTHLLKTAVIHSA